MIIQRGKLRGDEGTELEVRRTSLDDGSIGGDTDDEADVGEHGDEGRGPGIIASRT